MYLGLSVLCSIFGATRYFNCLISGSHDFACLSMLISFGWSPNLEFNLIKSPTCEITGAQCCAVHLGYSPGELCGIRNPSKPSLLINLSSSVFVFVKS